jgi:hypothetical protein
MKRIGWLALAVLVAPPAQVRVLTALPIPGREARIMIVGRDAPAYAGQAQGSARRAPKPLTVVPESGKALVLTEMAWKQLPRQKAKARDHSGTLATYEGVTLATVLQEAGVALGKELRGQRLANYLLVEAADGYRVAFSLAEIDPDMSEGVVLLADTRDGKPLDAKEGPYRLVVPRDKRYSRWVRQVIRLSVRQPSERKGGAGDQ